MVRRHFFHYESMHQPLLQRPAFLRRLAGNFGIASLLIAVSLFAGMAGYHFLESMTWMDAYVNASMILSGMGPLDPPKTPNGKLFAGTYALYSGLALILATGLLLAPVLHRMLHRFHLDTDKGH